MEGAKVYVEVEGRDPAELIEILDRALEKAIRDSTRLGELGAVTSQYAQAYKEGAEDMRTTILRAIGLDAVSGEPKSISGR